MKAERILIMLLVVSRFSVTRCRNVRAARRSENHRSLQSVNDLMHLKASTKKDSSNTTTRTRGKGNSHSLDSKSSTRGKGGSTKGKGALSSPPATPPTEKSGKGGKKSSKGSIDEDTEAPTVHPACSPSPVVASLTDSPSSPVEAPTTAPAPSPLGAPTIAPAPGPVETPTTAPAPGPVETPTTAPAPGPVETPTLSPSVEPAPTAAPQPGVTTSPTLESSEAPTLSLTTLEPSSTSAPTPGVTVTPSLAASEAPSVDNSTPGPTPVPTSEFETTLGLERVPDRFQSSFVNAARIWDTVIVGDMPELVVDDAILNSPSLQCDPTTLPDVIDDIFICASVVPIDGPSGVLGTAGPTSARFGDTITVTIGFMNFDEADMDLQLEAGTLQGLILHEMAHVYGFGTLWQLNNLAPSAVPCPYKYDSSASEQYRILSGCDAPIPVESNFGAGTQCLHWDESCFLGELMTGFSTEGLELSVLTIAALDDLGYTVDYSKADPFDTSKMSPDCVCNRRQLRGTSVENHVPAAFSYQGVGRLPLSDFSSPSTPELKPQLSEEGLRIARAHGMSILDANHEWKNAYLKDKQAELYIGDQIIVVLYMENGYKYTVMVTR